MMAEAFSNIIGKPFATPISRISFPSLVAPDTGRQYSDDKYKITQLFEKETTDFSDMKAACLAVAQEAWGKDIKLNQLALTPFKNGDERSNWQGYEGCIFVTSKSKFPVQCFGPKKVEGALPVIPAKDVYAGCKARAILVAMAFMRGSDKGVTFLLNSVQFLEDAPRFGGLGAVDAADLFGEYGSPTAAAKPMSVAAAAEQVQNVADAAKKRGRPPKAAEPAAAEQGNGADDDALPLSGAAKQSGSSVLDMI